jgi:hypothetical protein
MIFSFHYRGLASRQHIMCLKPVPVLPQDRFDDLFRFVRIHFQSPFVVCNAFTPSAVSGTESQYTTAFPMIDLGNHTAGPATFPEGAGNMLSARSCCAIHP